MTGDGERDSTAHGGQLGNRGVLAGLLEHVVGDGGEVIWSGVFDFGAAGSVTLRVRDVDVLGMAVPDRDVLLISAARLATLGMVQTGVWPAGSSSPGVDGGTC